MHTYVRSAAERGSANKRLATAAVLFHVSALSAKISNDRYFTTGTQMARSHSPTPRGKWFTVVTNCTWKNVRPCSAHLGHIRHRPIESVLSIERITWKHGKTRSAMLPGGSSVACHISRVRSGPLQNDHSPCMPLFIPMAAFASRSTRSCRPLRFHLLSRNSSTGKTVLFSSPFPCTGNAPADGTKDSLCLRGCRDSRASICVLAFLVRRASRQRTNSTSFSGSQKRSVGRRGRTKVASSNSSHGLLHAERLVKKAFV